MGMDNEKLERRMEQGFKNLENQLISLRKEMSDRMVSKEVLDEIVKRLTQDVTKPCCERRFESLQGQILDNASNTAKIDRRSAIFEARVYTVVLLISTLVGFAIRIWS